MKKILITGGTVFVSKFTAAYFVEKGYDVFVLNRGNRPQVAGVTLIQGDRHQLKNLLSHHSFDAVFDITAYDGKDIEDLVNGLGEFKDYILISSGAVYQNELSLPYREDQKALGNPIWGSYSLLKKEAEETLLRRVPHAYILRPPYLYGPMQNLYREPFVFECAMQNRPFYIPKDGTMPLQFFHVEDLCRLMEILIKTHPEDHLLNVGNTSIDHINSFVEACYQVVGTPLIKKHVWDHEQQRDYFSFHDYTYMLDVSKQNQLLPHQKDLKEGLQESYEWYLAHKEDVIPKEYLSYIDEFMQF